MTLSKITGKFGFACQKEGLLIIKRVCDLTHDAKDAEANNSKPEAELSSKIKLVLVHWLQNAG